MMMDEKVELTDERSSENLQDELNAAKEEIQNLTQQLNCLLVLTKNAWHGDESATLHLARVIGVGAENEQNAFVEKKITERTSTKKTVTIAENEEVLSKHTPSVASYASQENLCDSRPAPPPPPPQVVHANTRSSYLQPFLQQSHIDPIREQDSRRIFNSMLRYRQNETRKPPPTPNRSSPTNVRPRATKHLYRPASAEHVVRHLGSPLSRPKPYFVFAGKEFFQQRASQSPLYQRGLSGSRQSNHSDLSDESDVVPLAPTEPVLSRPQTAKSAQQLSTIRFGARSLNMNDPPPRISSALSSTSSTKLSQLSERERRDAMRLQRQLNLPRQGWLNQYS